MHPNSRPHPHIPSLDLSLLDRPETKDQLLSILRGLADAQSDLPASLPEDPILQLVAVSQLGLEQMRLNKSGLTSRSGLSSSRGNEKEREVKKLRREVKQQRRALANYEFFLRQPEVAETVNRALGRLNTLKCVFCHKFFTSQHYLEQHVVRRHPELAGLGAERLKTTVATDRRHTGLKHRPTDCLSASFLLQFEALHKAISSVNAQSAQTIQDLASKQNSEKLREVARLQQELSRLLEQQQRLLTDQTEYSPAESQQTSFFDRASVGEAALESLRSEQSRKWELDGTGRLGDMQEDWKNEAPTRRRLESMDLARIEISFREAKKGQNRLGEARKKMETLKQTMAEFAFAPEKYASELRGFFPCLEEEVTTCRKRLVEEANIRAKQRNKPIPKENLPTRESFKAEAERLQAHRNGLFRSEPIQTGLEFSEGAVVHTLLPTYVGMVGPQRAAKSEKQRESLLSLDYENSVSFSIRWGDEEEESGEWRGVSADEARRLGFFFH